MKMRFFALVSMAVLLAGALMGCAQKGNVDSEYGYETKELYAKRDEHQIYGVIYIPENKGEQMPAVIFSHGYGGNH